MQNYLLSDAEIKAYHNDGFVIVRNFLNESEIQKLYTIATTDNTVNENVIDLNDRTGKKTKLTLWYKPGNDAFGLLTKSERMVKNVDLLMEGKSAVCHFHSKLMQKEPRVGGAWEWHQDYGYWYKNEFLMPNQMISVMVAITDANKENGCLQVIKGTHKMGRIEHGFAGEQVGASQRYVDLALKKMEHVFVELKAGDALFFHSNLLHRSEANTSDKARWSIISCYNRQENVPYNEPSESSTIALETVPNDAILTWKDSGKLDAGNFLKKENDKALL